MKSPNEIAQDYSTLSEDDKNLISNDIEIKLNRAKKSPLLHFLTIETTDLEEIYDHADRMEMVKNLANRLVIDKITNTYSINGPWGSGKTIFLKWLYNRLKEDYGERVFPIFFESWKYESTGNIIYPLIKQLKLTCPPKSDPL